MKQIKIHVVEGGHAPTKERPEDPCFDAYSRIATTVLPNAQVRIPLGFKIELPKEQLAVWQMFVKPKENMALRNNLHITCSDIITADYTGEIYAYVRNASIHEFYVNQGMLICRLIITRLPIATGIELVDFEV